jgi:hypothetical protein
MPAVARLILFCESAADGIGNELKRWRITDYSGVPRASQELGNRALSCLIRSQCLDQWTRLSIA